MTPPVNDTHLSWRRPPFWIVSLPRRGAARLLGRVTARTAFEPVPDSGDDLQQVVAVCESLRDDGLIRIADLFPRFIPRLPGELRRQLT
jgi:hypothetical protein